MKISLLFLLVIILSFPVILQGQIYHNQNNIFLEAFGNAGGYSLNYERVILDDFSGRVGVMVIKSGSEIVRAFPIIVNRRFYINQNYVEIGIGATIFSTPLNFGVFGKKEANGSILTGLLVSRQLCNVGYNRLSFIRALSVVNCQLIIAFALFLCFCQALHSFVTVNMLSILLFKH